MYIFVYSIRPDECTQKKWYVYMYIYVYTYKCIYAYICIYAYVYICILYSARYMHPEEMVRLYIFTNACITALRACVCIYIYIYIYIHIYMYIYVYE
jgi:hypothetical protein